MSSRQQVASPSVQERHKELTQHLGNRLVSRALLQDKEESKTPTVQSPPIQKTRPPAKERRVALAQQWQKQLAGTADGDQQHQVHERHVQIQLEEDSPPSPAQSPRAALSLSNSEHLQGHGHNGVASPEIALLAERQLLQLQDLEAQLCKTFAYVDDIEAALTVDSCHSRAETFVERYLDEPE